MERLFGIAGSKGGDPTARNSLTAMATAADVDSGHLCGLPSGSGVGAVGEAPAYESGTVAAIVGQPMWSDAEIDRVAHDKGHASALLALWRRNGPEFPGHLHGHFASVVLDTARDTACLAVDRLGIYGLYYTAHLGNLLFATELQTLLAHPGAAIQISAQAIYEYVYFHMIPSPGTVYAGVRKLGPAQRLLFQRGTTRIDTYWRPVFDEVAKRSLPDLSGELHETLYRCVGDSIDTGRKVGCFLSGGLDSSTVAGKVATLDARGARTYSIGFDAAGYDETPYARVTARHFQTDHHEYYVTPDDVVDSVPQIAAAYGEPFGNSSALPAYLCAKRAREDGVELMLAGDGGDELFAGNARYAKQRTFEHYGRLPLWLRREVIEPGLSALPRAPRLPGIAKMQSYVDQARVPLPDRLQSYNFLHRHDATEIFDRDFLDSVDKNAPLEALRARFSEPDQASSLNRILYLDWKFTLADNDIRKVSQTCALAGVGVVYPLLDDRLVEFSCHIPTDLKLRGRELRYFYRKAMRGFLPAETLRKRKHGFGLPFGVWMQRYAPLRELAYDSLTRLKGRQYFQAEFIDHAIELHRTGHAGYYGELVWILMMLELWFEHRADAACRPSDLSEAARSSGRAAT